MNIKEFLGDSPLESVTQDKARALLMALEIVGDVVNVAIGEIRLNNELFVWDVEDFTEMAEDLNLIHTIESAVIEKVSQQKYGDIILDLLWNESPLEYEIFKEYQFTLVARATAAQRLTAILLALSEVE